MLTASIARPRQGYLTDELKAAQLRSRRQVAWPSWTEMFALRWKVPNWVDTRTAPDSPDPDVSEEEDPSIIRRKVRLRGKWQSQKIYMPPTVADYNKYMGDADLFEQITAVNKRKEQQQCYMSIFIKFLSGKLEYLESGIPPDWFLSIQSN